MHTQNKSTAAGYTAGPWVSREVQNELWDALQMAKVTLTEARAHYPKSVRNHDRFSLELAISTASKALSRARKES